MKTNSRSYSLGAILHTKDDLRQQELLAINDINSDRLDQTGNGEAKKTLENNNLRNAQQN
ncbi:CIC11C00000002876 [Sungouiella intermedia]|uniref:CIC11C00000002876 n=1 Tax=Sungouiella intermedia TaxID=45354 RepID=A0A1L0D504_9ASCO|nr:CIC11C00000002876 [[Candida] intermedia]